MPGLCMSHVTTRVRTRVRSPVKQYKKTASFITKDEKFDQVSNELSFDSYLSDSECGNRVMVVIDLGHESKGALEWILSNAVQAQDTLILLHVSKQDGNVSNGEVDQRGYELLCSSKYMCQLKRPEVHVEMAIQQGNEKGAIIVKEVKRLKISLLVLGHHKQTFLWRLRMIWTSNRARSKVVDYCIENANCMTIAVRRKNKKHGGYLITTKRHKKFWLLA